MPRDLPWDGCVNVRDLGGFATPTGTTAFGVFVRANNARRLAASGWRAASEYGIRTILDLRSDPECAADPPAHPDFNHVRISLFDHFDGDEAYRDDLLARIASLSVVERYRTLYWEALELDGARFAEAAGVIADADDGVLFHCAGGKDRTGVLAALLLRLVDVSMEAVEADYVLSEERLRPAVDPPLYDISTPHDVIDHVLGTIETQHGSVETYLLHAGVSSRRLARIRSRFADGQ
jgi:protein-tyrosine phosphatase